MTVSFESETISAGVTLDEDEGTEDETVDGNSTRAVFDFRDSL